MTEIKRFGIGPRMSQAVVPGNMVGLAGLVGNSGNDRKTSE